MTNDAPHPPRYVSRRPRFYIAMGVVLLMPAVAWATGALDWQGTLIIYTSVAFSMALLALLRWIFDRTR